MNTLILILFICISIYSSISWLLPKLLAWLFKRKFKIKLQIGRIAIPKFVLKDVNVSKNGYSIHIDEVSFRSSFFNSDVNKFLSIVIRDVRINNNVEEKRSVVVENILKPLLSKQNSGTNKSNMQSTGTDTNNFNKNLKNSLANLSAKEVLDFRETKLPPSLITFAQFMAIHIYNVSIMVLHGESDGYTEDGEDGWFLHATTNTIHIDGGAGGASRTLLVSASITDASAKLLPRKKHICLGELSCGMLMEVTLKAHGPLSIEKVQCTINSPVTSIHEELYSFLQEFRSSSASKNKALQTDIKFSPGLSEDLFYRLSPVIPKNFSLKIDTTTLTGIQYNDRIEFHASLQSLQINSRFSALQAVPTSAADSDPNEEVKLRLPQVYVAFQMDQLKINTNKEKLLFLNKLKLDAKLEKSVLNLYLIMNVISLTYNHEDVYGWYSSHFQKDKKKNVILTKTKKEIPAWVDNLFSVCVVQGCAELWNVSLHSRMKHGHCNLALGCGGLKIKLDQLTESRMAPYESNIPRLLLGSRHWSTELLVDSGWLAAGPGALNMVDPPQKKQHIWGTTLFLGVALVKWGSHGPLDSKVEAMLDCFKVEWSTTVGHTLVSALGCLQDYSSGKVSATPSVPSRSNSQLTITVALTNVNIFTVIDETMCLMSRIDAVSIDKNEVKSAFVISGLKMVDIVPYKGGWVCQRADEMLLTFFHIKLARIEFTPPSKTATSFLDVQLLESMDMEWSPNLHLKFLTVIREIQRFRHDIRTMLRKGMRKEEIEQSDNGESKNWNVILKGDTCIGLLFSRKNHLLISADEINISKDSVTGVSVVWNTVKAILNGEEIIMVDGLAVERVADDPIIRGERLANEDFVLDWNKVWGVNIVSIRIVLPYRHNFAEAIQGEFVSTFKWLKVVHEIKKKSFTAHSPLPSDLLIKVEEFVLEMSDDPFEVKLRDNCELLEDEYKESLKRKTMLDAKIAELCKPHLFLPAGKVEQLYTALRHKDAQIYVQRSRAAPPPRTRLVACVFGGLEILALADPSIHGTENCIKSMQEIDPESPWPEDGIDFTTLWCRGIVAKCATWQLLLRDFPQPLLSMKGLKMWGEVVGAEQAAPPRALRSVTIDQGVPWGKYKLERGMMPLKIYHDLNCEMEYYSYSFGPCWEPVIAQCNMSFEQVSRPSLDPSLPLAWWDKMRLLLHGRLTVIISQFTCLLHASLDPYNTTEEMELTWTDVALDWTNAKLVFRGELNVYVRTASKYDDCRLLHLPGLRLAVKLSWLCVADPRDHHSVVPCAPDKLPEYSSNQEHDSFRAFRSQGLDMHISLETKPCVTEAPVLLLYGSTLRWFESLKLILSGVTRPTRRGTVFRNVRPRRPQLSRHYRAVRLSLTLHSFQVWYWSSSSMQRGIELNSGRLTCGSEHTLALVPANDGLVRRPRAAWTTVYMNCELNDAEMWLKCIMQDNIDTTSTKSDTESRSMSLNTPTEKCYCLSMGRVSYGREAALGATLNRSGAGAPASAGPAAPPTHRLTVHDLRGAWTKTNRDVAFALFDTYMKTKQLKKNLSTKALKEVEKTVGPPKMQREADVVSPLTLAALQAVSPGGPPHAAETMLAQLVAEAEREPPVVFSDDLSGGETTTTGTAGTSGTGGERIGPSAHGPKHYMEDENVHNSWHIELVNSQVLLKGCETRGYVILCAARAQVRQRVRRAPAPATSWSGEFAAMQYYATVQAGEANELQDIQWVSVDEIQEKSSKDQEISTLPDVPRLVGSGHSAGGVIGSTVGPSSDTSLMQLQRMVSRCACEFYYLSYDDEAGTGVGRGGATGSGGTGAWNQLPPEPYDSFTLMHHDLEVCTNSLQYAMLLDVVNNLVLYVEPERRRTLERRARMRFQLQLHSDKDPRKPIQILQHQVRGLVANLRRLEKESYLLRRALVEHDRPDAEEKLAMQNLEDQVYECKEQLLTQGEELDAMVHAWREAAGRQQRAPPLPSATAAPLRVNEICFKSARWRLTDADGQLGIADLVLTNFLYTKTSRTDDSVEHQLELGYIRVTNLLPREPFQEVLLPQAPSGRAPLARRAALRVFCRDRPPVGGISVKEHLEVNVVPITIGLTKKFFNTMLKFCFPERDPDTIEAMDGDDDDTASLKSGTSSMSTKKSQKKKSKDTNFYVKIEQKDDVEKMKERAEKNKLFIYIKIPEVPVRVSYKGSKEKNLEDVRDMPLVLPTLEYHNVTWTWLDLLLAMKTDTRRVLVSQAIRQRLQLHRRAAAAPEPQEEDKARLLLGDRTVTENKPQKKSVPGVFKFSK